jgi:hypothetical protein
VAQFKGIVFESTRMYTERHFGTGSSEKVLSDLSATDRELLSSVDILGWYPVEPVIAYHYALDKRFGRGDLALCSEAGRFSATWSMNTVLKVFLRFKSPTWLIDRATRVWGRYHDTGHWNVTNPAPNRIVGELVDHGIRDPAFCARLCGWLQGAIEATGGQGGVVTETACKCRGQARCTFELTWRL